MGFLLLVANDDWRPLTSLTGFFMSCPSGAPDPSGWALRSTGPGYAFLLGAGQGGLQGNAVHKKYSMPPPENKQENHTL